MIEARKEKEKIGYRSVGRSVGWSTFFSCLIFSMDSRNRSGVGRWQIAVLSFRMSCFFSKIGGISSKYSSFYRFYAANMFVWMDERMDGRFVVGDMSTLVTLTILSPFSPHRYPYLSHPPRTPNQPNQSSSSVNHR